MGQVHHGSATTTAAIRRANQQSQASLRTLAKRYGTNQKTVAKWRKRTDVSDLPISPQEPRSTVLSVEDEAVSRTGAAASMISHELATDALKHGSLKRADGSVTASWSRWKDGRLSILWQENGGEPVRPPSRGGFGSRLIRQLAAQLEAEVAYNWGRNGMGVRLTVEQRRPFTPEGRTRMEFATV